MAYPTGTDLAGFLVARGIITAVPGDLGDLDDIMLGVVRDWEEDTGWIPFFQPAGELTRNYTLFGNLLFLNSGLITVDSLNVDGNELEEGFDFWLEPANEDRKTRVVFNSLQNTNQQGIEINGHWGYTDDLSSFPDVKRALLAKGAAEYCQDVSNTVIGTGGSVKRMKQDDVEKEFGSTGGNSEYSGTLIEQFGKRYRRTVARFLAPWKVGPA